MTLKGTIHIKFDNNVFKICEYAFSMLLSNVSDDWKSKIDSMESVLTLLNQFFIPNNKNIANCNMYCKKFLNFYHISCNVISMIKLISNQEITIPGLLQQVKNIAGLFSNQHEETVNTILECLRRSSHITQEIWDARCSVKVTIVKLERELNREEITANYPNEVQSIQKVLKSVAMCHDCVKNNRFTFNTMFEIINEFVNMCMRRVDTYKNQTMIVFDSIYNSIRNVINQFMKIKENIVRHDNNISIESVLDL